MNLSLASPAPGRLLRGLTRVANLWPELGRRFFVGVLLAPLLARAATPIDDYDAITDLLEEFLAFFTGPFGKAVVIISILAAFITWVFVPRESVFAPLLRITVSAIAIMNVTAWYLSFGDNVAPDLNAAAP